jgi:uncharacterized protein with PIN domain
MDTGEIPKLIADVNVGRLARWVRILGYDTLIFKGKDDADMLTLAGADDRFFLTRDSGILKRRRVTRGEVKAIPVKYERLPGQLQDLVTWLKVFPAPLPLSSCIACRRIECSCIECNQPLVPKQKEDLKDRIPLYVFTTQRDYRGCPACGRIYWRGTHCKAIWERLNQFDSGLFFRRIWD